MFAFFTLAAVSQNRQRSFRSVVIAHLAMLLIAFASKAGRAGQPLALFITGVISLLALAGVSGQIVRMAARTAHDGESANSWAASRRAATILTLSYILPAAGWFVISRASTEKSPRTKIVSCLEP